MKIMTPQELDNYFTVDKRIRRMASLINRFDLDYFQDRMKDQIISPLIEDGFDQEDIQEFFQVAIHAAYNGYKIEQ